MQHGRRWSVSLWWIACGGMTSMACAAEKTETMEFTAVGRSGMVASDSAEASQAGLAILEAGGNAVDAATATSLALSVARPFSTSLGGGGFLMVRFGATGQVAVLDYRECAPAAASADMYVKARQANPNMPPPSVYGGLAVGVPGLIAGHAALQQRFGTKTWAELVAPARRLATEGFAIDASYVSAVRELLTDDFKKHPSLATLATPLSQGFFFTEETLKPGTILRQPDLARTLDRMAEHGAEGFYTGPVADAIVRTVQANGGILTHEDLARYRARWREPIRIRYREKYEVLLMPPPSSGGVAIAEMLNVLEHWDLRRTYREDPGLAAHLTVEAMKHAFADRARHLGDADFVDVPVARLTSKEYAAALADRIDPRRVSEPAAYGDPPPDDAGTSHFCVADRWGNVVAATETINTSFGSLLVAQGTGVVLNNEMDDFRAEPHQANVYGLRQSAANAVEAGKRPLSSMSPTIVLADGKPVLAVGASGGPRIITATLQVLLNVIEYDQNLAAAVTRPRYHHQWQPNVVSRNDYLPDAPEIRGLRERGHEISDKKRGAVVQALVIDGNQYIGASDPRKGGRPAGY